MSLTFSYFYMTNFEQVPGVAVLKPLLSAVKLEHYDNLAANT